MSTKRTMKPTHFPSIALLLRKLYRICDYPDHGLPRLLPRGIQKRGLWRLRGSRFHYRPTFPLFGQWVTPTIFFGDFVRDSNIDARFRGFPCTVPGLVSRCTSLPLSTGWREFMPSRPSTSPWQSSRCFSRVFGNGRRRAFSESLGLCGLVPSSG